jgi:TusA-related sulfurtransferase
MIEITDRLDEVLARAPRLMAVLAQASPTFASMSRGELPRPMARLVTVEQAATVAGLEPAVLLERLNRALAHPDGDTPSPGAAAPATVEPAVDNDRAAVPEHLQRLPAAMVVECDVREDLRSGIEPFGRIMAAARETPDGGVLKIRATFEPAPLYAVLGKQGFSHTVERLASDDWRIWLHRAVPANPPGVTPAPSAPADPDADLIVLDVRGLEPPDPMIRTLEALADMPPGRTLVQINVRVPQFLIPKLEERGFTYEVREQSAGLVRIFIRHAQS